MAAQDRFGDAALERFTCDGYDCVIAVGGVVCGYVRLPDGHPWRHNLHSSTGPVSLTYGPDDDGWVGFDTMHARDVWAPDDIPAQITDRQNELDALLTEIGVDPGVLRRAFAPTGPTHHWTMPRMRETVRELARCAAHAAVAAN